MLLSLGSGYLYNSNNSVVFIECIGKCLEVIFTTQGHFAGSFRIGDLRCLVHFTQIVNVSQIKAALGIYRVD